VAANNLIDWAMDQIGGVVPGGRAESYQIAKQLRGQGIGRLDAFMLAQSLAGPGGRMSSNPHYDAILRQQAFLRMLKSGGYLNQQAL
jgi:hypothetical protein